MDNQGNNTRKKSLISSSIRIALIAIAFIIYFISYSYKKQVPEEEAGMVESSNDASDEPDNEKEKELITVNIEMSDHYITNTGDSQNLYYIDENGELWGSGDNQYGQLGQGIQDNVYHEDMIKIADNVIHVDYSQEGFIIYLTEDNKLYGMGNDGVGALLQFSFTADHYINGTHYAVTEPVLLMEDVIYARCGRSDVVVIKEDSSAWVWGTLWIEGGHAMHLEKPCRVLENVELVTGGSFNHAALLNDGSVWTWGYNYVGNCGVEEMVFVFEPQKVAEDVKMVWTASMNYNINCFDIRELDDEYLRQMENTIILKNDDTYWICGINVGKEKKTLPIYHQAADYTVVFTHEFYPYADIQ